MCIGIASCLDYDSSGRIVDDGDTAYDEASRVIAVVDDIVWVRRSEGGGVAKVARNENGWHDGIHVGVKFGFSRVFGECQLRVKN